VGVGALTVTLLFPLFLLGLLLSMERVERPLRSASITDELAEFLDTARPEEVEAFISDGLAPALERYWKRRRLARLIPRLSR